MKTNEQPAAPRITITAQAASGPGALSGYMIACSCGYQAGCGLETLAQQWAIDHLNWHKERAIEDRRRDRNHARRNKLG